MVTFATLSRALGGTHSRRRPAPFLGRHPPTLDPGPRSPARIHRLQRACIGLRPRDGAENGVGGQVHLAVDDAVGNFLLHATHTRTSLIWQVHIDDAVVAAERATAEVGRLLLTY